MRVSECDHRSASAGRAIGKLRLHRGQGVQSRRNDAPKRTTQLCLRIAFFWRRRVRPTQRTTRFAPLVLATISGSEGYKSAQLPRDASPRAALNPVFCKYLCISRYSWPTMRNGPPNTRAQQQPLPGATNTATAQKRVTTRRFEFCLARKLLCIST